MTTGSWIETFPGNAVWSNACLITKGMAHYGAVALGEIDQVCERLAVRQAEPDAWREEWCAMGARIEEAAKRAEQAGRRITAGDYFLRAGMYWFTGERFVPPGDQKREIGRKARHDYEVPGAAAYEYIARRPEVDPDRVVVMGYSFGGYYATRIAALEKRYCAGVAMSAPHWDLAAWQRDIKRRQDADPKSTPQSAFHFRWIMGCLDDGDAAIRKAEKFSPGAVAAEVTKPFLIVHAANDSVAPVANAHKLYDALGSKRKHLKILTAEEGGCHHAQMDNRQVGIDYIADWICDNLDNST